MIPHVTKELVDSYAQWIESADSEGERDHRMKDVYALLLDGVDDEAERGRIERMWRAATTRDASAVLPSVVPVIPQVALEQRKPRRRMSDVKLYDPRRSGFMRATREEGIGEDLRRMSDESRGSSLYGDVDQSPLSRETVDRVRKMLRIPAGKK